MLFQCRFLCRLLQENNAGLEAVNAAIVEARVKHEDRLAQLVDQRKAILADQQVASAHEIVNYATQCGYVSWQFALAVILKSSL